MRTNLPIWMVAALASAPLCQEPDRANELRIERAAGRSIALLHRDRELWRFHHDPTSPHWFFDPLALPGTPPLTVDSPGDHVWHHGLWFSWKYIDGVNYWENAPGAERPAGRTRYRELDEEVTEQGAARFAFRVAYAPDDDAAPVLSEARTIAITAPAADGSYAIDWTGVFTAQAERVVLDRTPPPGQPGGQSNGGYAGLSLRLANLDARAVVTTDGPQEFNAQDRLRARSNGFDYAGELDGAPVGIAVLAHPENPHAPSPWYAIRSRAMTFFTPAVICFEPLALSRGEQFTLRYRIVVHPGRWDAARLTAELLRYVRESAAKPPARLERDDERGALSVSFDGRAAFVYRYADAFAIPHVWPLAAPSGRSLLVQKTEPYPHHRALWIADRVQLAGGPDVDFYHEWKNLLDPERPELGHRSFIRHDAISDERGDGDSASFTVHATWIVDDDTPVLADARRLAARDLGDGEYLIDLDWKLTAEYGDVRFRSDAVHYAWPYLRMEPAYSVEHGGVLVDDRGRRGQAGTNGQVARWVDCSNTVDGVTEGVAVFVFPDGEDRTWLTRDYGTFGPRRAAAWNGTGFVLARGASIGGRVGILVHRGDAVVGRVAQRYAEYVSGG